MKLFIDSSKAKLVHHVQLGTPVMPLKMHQTRQDAISAFDRLTAEGYKLDLIKGEYQKPTQ